MKYLGPLLFALLCIPAFMYAQMSDVEIRALKSGNMNPDTSYVYWLPFASGSKYLLAQAYNSKMSHQHELALDFKMKPGRKICAARDGVVEAVKEDSNEGGMKSEYLSKGNHVIIRHADGSVAMYWHLRYHGVLVSIGDSVYKGQHIAFSGNTGYSAFPHLHFQVQDKNGRDMATRFFTSRGTRYLRPAKWYRSLHPQY